MATKIDEYLNKVTCIDCLELMDALPPQSVDALISDFPYNTTANEYESDIALTDAFWRSMWRVVKPNAPVVTTASQPFTALLTVKQLKYFRHEWIWEKTRPTGYLNANIAPMKTHENILVFSQETADYYPQMEEGEPYHAKSSSVGGHIRDKSAAGHETINEGERYPKSVLHFASINGEHPSQKPLDLYTYLVRTYSLPGAIILDPFAGSGTSLLAARNEGRYFIGGEKYPEYVAMANERLRLPFSPRAVTPANDVSDLPLFAALEANG